MPRFCSVKVAEMERGIPIVEARGLYKRYGGDIEALRRVDFTIEKGDIFGFIGPDGAGKTTLFHILGGVINADQGEVTINGNSPKMAKPDIGYLTQSFSLYLDLSISENIKYSASLRQVPREQFEERKRELLRLMDLDRFEKRLAGQLSGGMKQKLALCCALISRPKLLLLDEPTTGVDPVSRRELWDILTRISGAEGGVTVAVATPYLDEAERCSRIALMYEGSFESQGSPDQLKRSLHLKRVEARSSDLDALTAVLEKEVVGIEDIQEFGDHIDVLGADAESIIEQAARSSDRAGLAFEATVESPTLENVFVHELTRSKDLADRGLFKFSERQRMAKGELAIDADNLSKLFGDFWAVKNVSLQIRSGEIFGLLGANGAGKTTTIKILCGLLGGTSGSISLLGRRENLRSADIRRRLGYMSQKFTLYDDLTIEENLKFYCRVYGIEKERRSERIDWALSSCGLEGQENLITGKLPGGWKQRLAFGACVMHEPDLLFLDEPTSGVDPLARRQLWKLIRELARQGTAVLVTTHFLEEAEHCHNLAFMVAGEVVAKGSPGRIKSEQPGRLVELKVDSIQAAVDLLRAKLKPWQVSIFADRIHLVILEGDSEDSLNHALLDAGISVLSTRQIPFSLEDSFIGIVERIREKRAS